MLGSVVEYLEVNILIVINRQLHIRCFVLFVTLIIMICGVCIAFCKYASILKRIVDFMSPKGCSVRVSRVMVLKCCTQRNE